MKGQSTLPSRTLPLFPTIDSPHDTVQCNKYGLPIHGTQIRADVESGQLEGIKTQHTFLETDYGILRGMVPFFVSSSLSFKDRHREDTGSKEEKDEWLRRGVGITNLRLSQPFLK